MVERPDAQAVPDAPGCYVFTGPHGRVLYVGKAKSLRSRLATYFTAQESLPERARQMLDAAEDVEWIEVRTEVDALLLESELVRRHQPRFNIRLKDDKSFPYLAVTVDEEWPRAMVMRGKQRKGVRYFGPYAHAYAIRETLDLLLRTFPIRTCSDAKFRRHQRMGRPCLYAHIEKCVAPCVGAVNPDEYTALVDDLIAFLDGETGDVGLRLERDMREAADAQEYERAARLRDQLFSVQRAIESQEMVGPPDREYDAVAIDDDPLEASVQVFSVRRGRMVGRRGLIVDKVEDVAPAALLSRLLGQLYGEAEGRDVPKEILLPVEPEDREAHEQWLSARRGGRVVVRVPQRGDKRAFLATVTRNASEAFIRYRLRRSADHNARARALTALQEALGLDEAPLRIEGYDISHLQGGDSVGSLVVMEDGLLRRADYRHFRIRGGGPRDDYAAMEEVLTRRFRRYMEEREEGARSGKRFAYPPNLVLVDGGKGQLAVADRVLDELGLDEIARAALAKRFEEVYLPEQADPIRIGRDSEALYLLQQIRDEAHRFAVEYHRKLRGKRMTRSVLDDVRGLGPGRRKRLLREFGSLKRVRELSPEELHSLSWLPDSVGTALHERLHGPGAAPRAQPGSMGESGS